MRRVRILTAATAFALAVAAPYRVSAQPAVVEFEGKEVFAAVEYMGGDARYPKKLFGALVLNDSTIGFFPCRVASYRCEFRDGKPAWTEPAHFIIPLTAITSVEASSQVRSPGVASKIAWGFLANDRKEEYVGIVHETASSAEAPVFKVRQAQSAAIDAKIRFRLKKLGLELTTP